AWRNWKDGTAINLVDSSLKDGSRTEVMRCIHIGLLCVQENVAQRPNMASVVLMLTSYSVTLPLPSEPAFFLHNNTLSNTGWSQGFNSGATDSTNVARNEVEDKNSGAIISNQSRNEVAAPVSVNDVTITEMYLR
ncbi:cysteine-rich receptor-like protein kinase 29-like protein, partial [Corchorus olitorius]